MRLSKYCKDRNFTRDQYKQYKNEIENKALQAYEKAKELHALDTGIFYPIDEIVADNEEKYFIIEALKDLNVEFTNHNTKYRLLGGN